MRAVPADHRHHKTRFSAGRTKAKSAWALDRSRQQSELLHGHGHLFGVAFELPPSRHWTASRSPRCAGTCPGAPRARTRPARPARAASGTVPSRRAAPVPQPQPDVRRVRKAAVAPRPQVHSDGPGGGRGDEDHAPQFLGPGALERRHPDEPLAHEVERQVSHPHLGDLGAPQALGEHADERVVTDVAERLPSAASGHGEQIPDEVCRQGGGPHGRGRVAVQLVRVRVASPCWYASAATPRTR